MRQGSVIFITIEKLLVNSEALRSIHGESPSLRGVLRVRSININWRGPTVILRIDLPGFPEPAPQEWLDAVLDTMQCHLQFLAVEKLSARQWDPPTTAAIEVKPQGNGGRVRFEAIGDGIDLSFDCSDSVLVGHVSAFRMHSDGSDGGRRAFLNRVDARRYGSLPEPWEKVYYERL